MAEAHTKQVRLSRYQQGWRCAAGFRAVPRRLVDDEDFKAGYADGGQAAADALHAAKLRYDVSPRPARLCPGRRKEV